MLGEFSLEENHGSIQLDLAFPLYKGLKGYVQYFSGHGESLVDYNVTSDTFSLGIIKANWM
jgi:phospholipase A1